MKNNQSVEKIFRVWDLPTRLFHWCLLLAIFYSWLSVEILENMQHHFYSGYVVLTLLLFRLIWGFIGSDYAKFTSFLYTPSELITYIKTLWSPTTKVYLGHNPLGGLSAILMIFILLAQTVLGLFSSDDYFFGPLSGLVSEELISAASDYHSLNSDVLFGILGLHIVAIIFYKFRKNEHLTTAMITGKKRFSESNVGTVKKEIKPASIWLALLTLLFCIAVVYCLATAFLDRIPSASESYY